MISFDDLRRITVFADLDEDALAWLSNHMQELVLESGQALTQPGDPADWLFVLIEGQVKFESRNAGSASTVFVADTGEVSGMLPHSRMTEFGAASHAVVSSRIGRLHKQHFQEMLQVIPVLEGRFSHIMLDRTRASARVLVQQEKLAALGTMAAGLAHELNNPASAAKRAAESMVQALQRFDQHASSMLKSVMFKKPDPGYDPFEPVYEIVNGERPQLDALEASEREDELADWLETQGVTSAWEVAPVLVEVGFTRSFLERFCERLKPERTGDFLNWLPSDVEMRLLSTELAMSTTRISDLVQAMKSYSYMDQANEQSLTDVHKGIEDTLKILGHKLKYRSVEIVKNFGALPSITAYGGELNQVWTNLLDNALGALPEDGGRIEIRTAFESVLQCVQVEVIDNGHGIPDSIQSRIFEPFFTTKDTGEGTGLGLDISYRIVTARHGGSLAVTSEPGHTCFQVRLPVNI